MSEELNRRNALGILAALGVGSLLGPRRAQASVAVGIALPELIQRSSWVAFSSSLELSSQWEEIGGSRRIVTYNRVRCEELVAGTPEEPQSWVRTLGGRVGEIGQIAYGEAELVIGQPCLLFVQPGRDGVPVVTEMAQGHYPLAQDTQGEWRLAPSPRLGTLFRADQSAVKALAGRSRAEATALLSEARHAK